MRETRIHNIILSVIGFFALVIFNDMRGDISDLSKNIQLLNTKLATVVTNQSFYKERLDKHESRIDDLEKK